MDVSSLCGDGQLSGCGGPLALPYKGSFSKSEKEFRRKSIKALGQRDAKTRLDQTRGERAEMVPEPFLQAGRRWGWCVDHIPLRERPLVQFLAAGRAAL